MKASGGFLRVLQSSFPRSSGWTLKLEKVGRGVDVACEACLYGQGMPVKLGLLVISCFFALPTSLWSDEAAFCAR